MRTEKQAVQQIIQDAVDLGRRQVEIEIEQRLRARYREGYDAGAHEVEAAYKNVDKVIGAAFLVGIAVGIVFCVMFGPAVAGFMW